MRRVVAADAVDAPHLELLCRADYGNGGDGHREHHGCLGGTIRQGTAGAEGDAASKKTATGLVHAYLLVVGRQRYPAMTTR
jgi:hypothetical protein